MVQPEILAGAALALGLVVGSFLNVVIHRVPRGESVVLPPSHCPGCGRTLAAWENVPVFSWLALRGRCRGCGMGISPRYPAIEALTGVVFALLAWTTGPTALLPVWMLFAAGLIAAAAIDFDHQIIPDGISLGGLVTGLVLVPAVSAFEGAPLEAMLQRSLVGAVLGGGVLWLVGFVHARVSVALGRSFEHWPGQGARLPRPSELDYWVWFPGMGFGDVKLLAAIGAFLGPVGAFETIVAASLLGLIGGGLWLLATRRAGTPFGFGPAIALGALVVLLSPWHLVPN